MPDAKSKPKKKPSNPFISEDSEACCKHFAALVEDIPVEELDPWNTDAEILRVNVGRGVDAIRPYEADVREALPRLDFNEILELPSLALALGFAADRVSMAASPQEIRARQQQLRPSRARTLKYLEVAGELGLVPQDRVSAIRANTGPLDEARDAIAIVALFNERAKALENKHPFTAESLKKLAEDGNWLLQQLLPKGATPERATRSPEALLRDRLWTEVNRRYDALYQAGVAVWGRRKVDAHLPALLSRAQGAAKPADPGEPNGGAEGAGAPPGNTAGPA